MVAALALGAEGIDMGTRFIATKEAPVHDSLINKRLAGMSGAPNHAAQWRLRSLAVE